MRNWQFWIDVGGTFTDCVARLPSGELRRRKVLSSAVTKGQISARPRADQFADQRRVGDPLDFWQGWQLRWRHSSGQWIDGGLISGSDRDRGILTVRIRDHELPPIGTAYELASELDSPTVAVRFLLGLGAGTPLPPVEIYLGTTRGTNALLTRTGARTAFVTTRGFADILRIANQDRPELFALAIVKPQPLFERAVEIDERVAADGAVLTVLDLDAARRQLMELRTAGIESVAICLMHGYRYHEHERQLAHLARSIGFRDVRASHEVAPLARIVARGDTTLVDAYLQPVLRDYLARIEQQLACDAGFRPLRVLTSAGGLVPASDFRAKDSVLSGPAGGVVGYSRVARAAGFHRAIGFDMGGTSTDVSRFDGQYEREYETRKAGVRIVAPMLAIETVAAGGGSICGFDGVRLFVGPASAGADPGPACYGRGGPLTVTDLNFFLGRILPDYFPFPLHAAPVEQALDDLRQSMRDAVADLPSRLEIAEGLLAIANTQMAQAIRSISVAKGYDPRDYLLVPFGGAAGQHACDVARELEIDQWLSHPDAGLMSALGIGLADAVRHRLQAYYRNLSEVPAAELSATFARLADECRTELLAESIAPDRITIQESLELRYVGVDASLIVERPDDGDYEAAFATLHRTRYGYDYAQRPLELVAARVVATGHSDCTLPPSVSVAGREATPQGSSQTCFAGAWCATPVYQREQLPPGARIPGPAIVAEPYATTVLAPEWRGEILSGGALLVRRAPVASGGSSSQPRSAATDHGSDYDPVRLEVISRHLTSIAEQMGIALRNTATSVNVKERLDFSCAIFTAAGELVVNAPHIPVHLGAMGETVRRIVTDLPPLAPGDVLITNDPYRGGSHLPDITVVTPVHDPQSGELWFFTASRAHHAEIGGITPGSMPPFSTSLAEEGVLISSFKLVDRGQPRWEELRAMLVAGPFGSRSPADNLADLEAQVAANQLGRLAVEKLVERYTWREVQRYMAILQQVADRKLAQALARLPRGRHTFRDSLDDGSPICVAITIESDGLEFDFTGTAGVLRSNLNANRAIVLAAIMYCLRCMINEEVPLNHGLLRRVKLVLPECLLNPPAGPTAADCPAVVGGNVETSQRVVDVILGALGLAAASQGTMNNLLFGNDRFGYYETICGGSGATPDAEGADAVHTHMTNTRLTDPEVLELRFPVRLLEFSIRNHSGGDGAHRGGNGVVRRLQFLQPLQLSILSQRRGPYPPFGLAGGGPGALGVNLLCRADGAVEQLAACTTLAVQPADELIIQTPGGGGYGR